MRLLKSNPKKTGWAVFLALVICFLVSSVEAKYGGGTGEPNNPYLIYTSEQMNAIGTDPNDWDKHFKLMADIDLGVYTGRSFNIIGTDWSNRFTGIFDGDGHKISNFRYRAVKSDRIGLFGFIKDNAEIKNLCLANPNIEVEEGYRVGSLVAELSFSSIFNCYVEDGNVHGENFVGGLVGENFGGIILNCYTTCNVSGTGGSIGGLAGENDEMGIIANCYSASRIIGGHDVGGLVGWNHDEGQILDCYSHGSVSGDPIVGGLVGGNVSGATIANCYATSRVNGTSGAGGLVGNNHGTVAASFWDVSTSGKETSAGGQGLTTSDLQVKKTFASVGWDFTTPIWIMCDEPDYPKLWWEKCPIEAAVEIKPNTLNLKSKGKWITCYIWLPEDYNIADIDPNSILLEGEIEPDSVQVDEQAEVVIAKFSREDVCQILADIGELGLVEILISGKLHDATRFEGTAIIRVTDKGKKK